VRVADTDKASKATATFDSVGASPLITANALNEGDWGNKITVNLEQASSGSTSLFLSSLAEDVAVGDGSIKLASTTGLSKGSTIIISDGTNEEPLTVEGLATGGVVNLPSGSGVTNSYNKANTRVYIQLPTGDVKATVESATGFSAGAVIVFQSADPTTDPVYVILKAVKQSERQLEWATGLASATNGAAYIDIKGVETDLSLDRNPINEGSNSIVKANLAPSESVTLLKKGDKITFSRGTQTETLTVDDVTDTEVVFKETFKYSYAADEHTKIMAMTSSVTTLFADTYQAAGFVENEDETATITLDNGVKGLKTGDYFTLLLDETSSIEVQIKDVISETEVKLTSVPEEAFQGDGTKVRFTLKAGGTEIVVLSAEGFSAGNLIDIDDDAGHKGRYRISSMANNRITFEGVPAWSVEVNDATITAKQWVATTVKSKEFRIIAVYGDEEVVETFDKLSLDGTNKSYFAKEGVVNKVSTLIEVEDARPTPGESPSSPDDLPALDSKPLEGGADGIDGIDANDYIGTLTSSEERTGLVALEPVDEANIIAIPDLMMSFGGGNGVLSPDDVALVQLEMITHCEKLKDRFAVLDSIKGQRVQDVHAWRLDNLDSKYAALYYPWIKVSDPIGAENGNTRFIPPSGHLVGIYARSDTERGVHKAPANEIIRGVIELDRNITSGEQEILNPDGINCIRAFPGRGIRVWGARTISSDALWKYVNVRRLFLFLEESIDEGTQWVVFEPNDEKLWARVRQTITQFLTRVWKDGALMGTTPEEAFFVTCDRTTMTQDDIDNGRLIVLIGVAPVKPAEFVIFRIAQWTGGSAVTE
jgi:phage tail sheath protein FI